MLNTNKITKHKFSNAAQDFPKRHQCRTNAVPVPLNLRSFFDRSPSDSRLKHRFEITFTAVSEQSISPSASQRKCLGSPIGQKNKKNSLFEKKYFFFAKIFVYYNI